MQTESLSDTIQADSTHNRINNPKKKLKINKTYLICWIGVAIPLLGFVLFNGFPIIVSFISMFSKMEYNQLNTMQWNNFANFTKLFSDEKFFQSFKITFWLACSQFVSLSIALTIAGFLSQEVKGTRLFQTLYFVPYICSTVAVAIMWSSVLGSDGAVNAIFATDIAWLNNIDNPYTLTWAIFISIVWQAPGYGIVMYCSAFKAINPALYEAASLDGANAWHKFKMITLPGIAPITFFLLLAGLLAGFGTFDAAKIMAPLTWDGYAGPSDAGLTLMYYIYLEGVQFSNMGYASVMSWVLFVILMIPSVYLIKKRIFSE